MRAPAGFAVAVLMSTLAAAAPAAAGDRPSLREWGVQAGGGNSINSGVQYYAIHPYVGFAFYEPVDRWLSQHRMRGRWTIEPWVAFVSDQQGESQSDSFEIGVSPIFFRLAYGEGALRPFVEGGLGLVYSDLRSEVRRVDLGQRMQFSEQGGAGLEYAIDSDLAVTLSVRYRHISNAGLSENNPGLDTVFGLLGVVFR